MKDELIITTCIAPPGAGKTRWALDFMASRPARFVYAVDRNNVMQERSKLIDEYACAHKTKPELVLINSENTKDVRARVKDAPNEYKCEHTILIISHEALKISELDYYDGWTLIIDEAINAWTFKTERTPETKNILREYFSLSLDGKSGLHELKFKGKLGVTNIAQDDYLDGLMSIYKAAKTGVCFANIGDWNDANDWNWCSIWNFSDLKVFESVYVFASSFDQSLTYKFMEKSGVKFKAFELNGISEYQYRKLCVKYFDDNNHATAKYFKSAAGQNAFGKVKTYFADVYSPDKGEIGFWSCNRDATKYANLLKMSSQEPLPPMLAGSNSYLAHNTCAMIYAARPSSFEINCLKEFNITADEVIRSRETETLIQFVTRSSIRVPDDSRDVEFFVYSKRQADEVALYFKSTNLDIGVIVEHVDLGIPALKPTHQQKISKMKAQTQIRVARFRQKNKNRALEQENLSKEITPDTIEV
jgi:hypothetical protein